MRHRAWILPTAAAAMLSMWPSYATAQLDPAYAYVSYEAHLDPGSGDVPYTYFDEATGIQLNSNLAAVIDHQLSCTGGGGSVSAVGSTEIGGGLEIPPVPPFVQAQLENGVSTCLGFSSIDFGSGLDYQVQLLEIIPPPVAVGEVPAKIIAKGYASVSGSGFWDGTVEVFLDLAGVQVYQALADSEGNLTAGFNDVYLTSLQVDGTRRVRIRRYHSLVQLGSLEATQNGLAE